MIDFADSLPWFLVIILSIIAGDLLYSYFSVKKRYEETKREKFSRDLLLDSIAEGVYGLDLDGNCTFCNAATLRLLGYRTRDELVGRNLHALIHHTHADGTPYAAEDCKACLAFRHNLEIHLEDEIFWRADGTSFPAEYWSYPVHKGKRLVGAVVSFVDISARKEIEERIKKANRELDAFVYTVSHDLRTPISAIIGYSDLIRENHGDRLDDEVVELLGTLETQGHKMAILVEDLLALSTVGRIASPEAAVDANAELDYVLAELREVIDGSGATVKVGALPAVRIPATMLIQIFQNLLGNALRYAAQTGGEIEVGGSRNGSVVSFHVRDHGRGIPEEERERVFDLFYRGSTGKNVIGSGVGLATVRKIARLYGGDAWVEETPGGGATFQVRMDGV